MSGAATTESLRRGALGAYFLVLLYSIVTWGIPVDRIAVLLWMLAAFVAASIGRTRDDVAQMMRDWMILVAIYMAYDYSRGTADQWGIGVNYTLLRDIDRFLFFGNDPGVWLQQKLLRSDPRWYDVGGAIVYMLHFVMPVVPLAALRVRQRDEWLRYVRRFSLSLAVAVSVFIMFPAAPPWMSAEKGYFPPVQRITGRGWWELNLKTVSRTLDRGAAVLNAVAAMPSLHAGLALLASLWFTRNSRRWVRIASFAYPIAMSTALVYFGEHYVIDCLAGFLVVGASWIAVDKWETKRGITPAPDQLVN
jgi:PAP2 superfamily